MGSSGVLDSTVPLDRSQKAWLLLVLACGLAVRLPLLPLTGYAPDLAYWKSWASYSTAFGIHEVYALDLPGQNYPPVVLYLLWAVGSLYHAIWPAADDSAVLTAFVKLPALLGDLLAIPFLIRFASRRTPGHLGPIGAASLLAFHPALVWLSSFWGQVDILLGLLVAVAWMAAWRGAAVWTGLLTAVAILTKPQALVVLPAIAAVLLARRRMGGLLLAAGSAWIASFVLVLPFLAAGYRCVLTHIYTGAGDVYPYWSVNGFNPWWAAVVATGGGDTPLTYLDDRGFIGPITPRRIGLVVLLGATAWIVSRAFALARDPGERYRARAWRLLTLQWLAFFLLPTQMHERYLVPALVSFAPAAVLERRWFWIYGALSLGVFLNLLYMVPGIAIVRRVVRFTTLNGILVALLLTAVAVLIVIAEVRGGRRTTTAHAGDR
jgi:Gpi18-like mannosyltransferase